MLEHLETTDYIKRAFLLLEESFYRGVPVVNFDITRNCVQSRDIDWSKSCVNTDDFGAFCGKALGENASSASDVEDPSARQVNPFVNISEPKWIDRVQRSKFTLGIPPARSERFKF